jgi:hypothetical protein
MTTETLSKGLSSDPTTTSLSDRLQALKAASTDLNNRNIDPSRIASTETRVGDAATVTATCTVLPDNNGTMVRVDLESHQFPFFGSRAITVTGLSTGESAVSPSINLTPTRTDGALIRLNNPQSTVVVSGIAGHLVSPFPTLVVPSGMPPIVVDCTPQQQR